MSRWFADAGDAEGGLLSGISERKRGEDLTSSDESSNEGAYDSEHYDDDEEAEDNNDVAHNVGAPSPRPVRFDWSSMPTESRSAPTAAATATLDVFPRSEPAQDCLLLTALQPVVPPASAYAPAPTSMEGVKRIGSSRSAAGSRGASDQPVTFRAKVKSSGYGSVAPRKPAWAKASAAAASGNKKAAGPLPQLSTGAVRPVGYPVNPDPDAGTATLPTEHDLEAWGHDGGAASSASGRSTALAPVSSSHRPTAPASSMHVPCGPVSCLRYSGDGTGLAVASHDGRLFTLPAAAVSGGGVRLGSATSHIQSPVGDSNALGGGAGSGNSVGISGVSPRLLCLSWSHGSYPGLSQRLVQGKVDGPAKRLPTSSRGPSPLAAAGAIKGGGAFDVAAAQARAKSRVAGSASGAGGGVDTSGRCSLVLACGDDRQASIWAAGSGRAEPVMTIRSVEGNGSSSSKSTSQPFTSTISSGCFYHRDKFVLLAAGDCLHAYTWTLHDHGGGGGAEYDVGGGSGRAMGQEEDVVRLRRKMLSQGRYRLASKWRCFESGSTVTSVTAHNSFRSNLVFAAGSDRSVRVYDAGAPGGQPAEVLLLPEAHSRAVHTLTLPLECGFADVSPASLQCFVTASTDGLCRLWDLRTNRCARQLHEGHVNRVHTVGAALSPDLTYLAIGSEDRSAVIYDLRTSEVVAKLRGATDTATSVAWHPTAPHLAVGSLDAGVRCYKAAACS